MKMAGSSWSTLLLSKIAPACAGPPERFSKQRTLPVSSMRHRVPSLETGTLLPWPIRFHFRAWPIGMSVLAVTVDCDEKIGGRLRIRRGQSGNPRLERETWGTPGCYSADIKCRCAFSRARCRPPANVPSVRGFPSVPGFPRRGFLSPGFLGFVKTQKSY